MVIKMKITNITELSKTKVKVYIDDDICFALYKSELRKFSIKKDEEIPAGIYDIIMNEVLLKRAKLRCMNLLKSRDYTRHQLESKLRDGCYPGKIIDAAAEYVASYGYIDDVRYAGAYIGYAGRTKSRKQIENDLLRRGVSREDITKAYKSCIEEDCLESEDELIKKILRKKHFDRLGATYKERCKMAGFLYRKGFEMDKIYKAVGQNIE